MISLVTKATLSLSVLIETEAERTLLQCWSSLLRATIAGLHSQPLTGKVGYAIVWHPYFFFMLWISAIQLHLLCIYTSSQQMSLVLCLYFKRLKTQCWLELVSFQLLDSVNIAGYQMTNFSSFTFYWLFKFIHCMFTQNLITFINSNNFNKELISTKNCYHVRIWK